MRTPPRILVVDDNPTNLEVLRVRLNAHGYDVVTAVDGEDALNRARGVAPDLVLLDVMMPKLDGISVVRELKQDNTLRFTPIILVTARSPTRATSSSASRPARTTISLNRLSMRRSSPACVRCSVLRTFMIRCDRRPPSSKSKLINSRAGNRMLEERVAGQLAQIERIGRLQRFLAPQVAQMIANGDASDSLLASHRREVTAVFCDLRGFTAFTEASEPEEVMGVLRLSREPRRAHLSI